MNSDIVLDSESLTIKGPGGVTIEGKTAFMDTASMADVTADDLTATTLTAVSVKAPLVNALAIMAGPQNKLTLDARNVKTTAVALMLDNSTRRKNQIGDRRALVHDQNDGLTINCDKDYPGGVTIDGGVDMPQGMTATAVTVKGPLKAHAVTADAVTIHGQPIQVPQRHGEGPSLPSLSRNDLVLEGTTIRARQVTSSLAIASSETVLNGAVTLNVTLTAVTVKGPQGSHSKTIPGPTPTSAIVTTIFTRDELVLNGTTILARSFRGEKGHDMAEVGVLDVIQELRQLRTDVKSLQTKVTELETKLSTLPGQGG